MFISRFVKALPQALFLVMLALALPVRAEIITPSQYAVIMDFDTGKVLYSKTPMSR